MEGETITDSIGLGHVAEARVAVNDVLFFHVDLSWA